MTGEMEQALFGSIEDTNSKACEGKWCKRASTHVYYDWAQTGLKLTDTHFVYVDLVTTQVMPNIYWAALNHRRGYIGFQSKEDVAGNPYSQFHCSVWDYNQNDCTVGTQCPPPDSANDIKIVHCEEGASCERFGHEGTGLRTHLQTTEVLPHNGMRISMVIEFQPTEKPGIGEISCYFRTDGFNGGQWFKQFVWQGPDGPSHGCKTCVAGDGSGGVSFNEKFQSEPGRNGEVEEAVYAPWVSEDGRSWTQVRKARSKTQSATIEYAATQFSTKPLGPGDSKGFASALCGCKGWEEWCPGAKDCPIPKGSGNITNEYTPWLELEGVNPPPAALEAFMREVIGVTAPPTQSPSTTSAECKDHHPKCTTTWKKRCHRSNVAQKCPLTCGKCNGGTLTTQKPSPGPCKGWCERDTEDWSEKCTWVRCSGCDPCTNKLPAPSPTPASGPCEAWCANHPDPWSEKCTFRRCTGCSACR